MFIFIVSFSCIYISQGSLGTWWDRYDNYIIANCSQSVLVKEFWKSVNNWPRYGQK